MKAGENLRIGLDGLIAHKLRSVLTALGIIFGVAAVIAMLSIGEGAREEALEQIRLMGMNNILIRARVPSEESRNNAQASFSPGLLALDAEAILEICPNVEFVVPQWEKNAAAQVGSERHDVRIIGTTPEYLRAFGYRLRAGRFLLPVDLPGQANVCVIGADIQRTFFRGNPAIGKELKIDDLWFSVVGVMESQSVPAKKVGSFEVRNLNMDVYIPLTTAQYKMARIIRDEQASVSVSRRGQVRSSNNDVAIPRDQLDQLTVKVTSEEWISEVTTVIERILTRRHYGVPDYEVIVPEALLQQSQQTQKIFNIVMGAIAGISLLVGGIGIMNIMLASVLERTKEIGIRRAIGATQADVLGQFLFEAVFLSIVGGLVGIALGFGLTEAITLYAGWRTTVSPPAVLMAFTVSAMVGIAFGFYPARKAARQNPIESLRYE